ncbi:MBL fold metallo-hydrolase RNA specificity domain-containing protein [Pelagibius sp. Alg239-R121]|uniref:MBL fold metallo-hydrolase RNA specificity domain-containing protein n=1 Tax=Pelagibius sp. Alg239-R121 TaxID=2993448 RepID=UPI0024A73684|nr:MBL fold metallo-hydrolase [Pelagibius sp. Alg239-R121]
MTLSLKFCGAAGTVTGSCFWLRCGGHQILIDCGLFQGSKTLKSLNYDDFPFEPKDIDCVLLTHAHIDHSGLIPRLIRQGFAGPVYATAGTRDLLTYMLPDSGHIQEMEVKHLNRRRRQRAHRPIVPIYTHADAEKALNSLRALAYEQWHEIAPGAKLRFWNAGHILGAASIELELADDASDGRKHRLLFSGDIGPDHKLFHPDPDGPTGLDYVICEATYGGRNRTDIPVAERRRILAQEVTDALNKDGVLLIPSFAVERTQELLADLAILISRGVLPHVPVFLDSPLAIRATKVFEDHAENLEDISEQGAIFSHPAFHFTETVDQSKAIARYSGGVIVIAASGMCDAGRIRHHLKHFLSNKKTTVLIVGYQAPGTLGRLLLEGTSAVRIQGSDIRVKARIRSLDFYSGHADGNGLIDWIRMRLPITRGLFLVHGEQTSLNALKEGVTEKDLPADSVIIPKLDDEFDLSGHGAKLIKGAAPRRLAVEAVNKLDWHNRLAAFSLDLRGQLEAAGDDTAREAILARLAKSLASNPSQ